jgi:pullulanase
MDYLERKRTHFVLWRPVPGGPTPSLVIGTYDAALVPALRGERTIALRPATGPGLDDGTVWELPAAECGLESGGVYHYWFLAADTNVYRPPEERQALRCTDPAAFCVDWRLRAAVPEGYGEDDRQPAGVVRFVDGTLLPADPGPPLRSFDSVPDAAIRSLPHNNRLVIYELPAAWTRRGAAVDQETVGVGTFRDVLAMVEPQALSSNFAGVAALAAGRAHLLDLGVNALELLPPADSFVDRSHWGYATSNYFAPDFDLGRPQGQDASSACADLIALVRACHASGVRLFVDVVMGFATHQPYARADYLDYFVQYDAGDPEQGDRNGFGGDLWKYAWRERLWDPVSGEPREISPARQFHKLHLRHWLEFFHIDGVRLDSLNNVASYDFIGEFRDEARRLWRARFQSETGSEEGADARFLVVGEQLYMPRDLLSRVDGLWNEHFRRRVRSALLGRSAPDQPSFEWTVREMVDCRLLGFADGSQAVNYLGSHDVTNPDGDTGNDRMWNFLDRFSVEKKEERMKLAFVCLLTAVGVPMIFAGDEFADRMDFDPASARRDDAKQSDPLNLDRLEDPWRRRLFEYVSRLVRLRTRSDALSVNDTEFLHADLEGDRRVLVWRRGGEDQDPVVVVANFSDFGTDLSLPEAEYRVPNWPETPPGRSWREVTQDRAVPAAWVGREPIFPWEAKVYTLE